MLEMFSTSKSFYIVRGVIIFFMNIYQNSFLVQVIRKICFTFKGCYFGRLASRYEEYEPIFIYSKSFTLMRLCFQKCKNMIRCIAYPFQEGKLSFVSEAKVVHFNYEIMVFLIVLYGFFDWIFRQYFVSFSNVWDELFLVLLCFMWLYKWGTRSDAESIKMSPFDFPIIVFIGLMIVLMLFSPKGEVALEGLRAITQSILWYFLAFQLMKNENTVRKLVMFFVSFTGVLAIHGVYQYIIGVEMPSTWISSSEVGIRTRVYSIFTSPNIFGSLLVLGIPMCVALVFFAEKKIEKKIFLILGLCMCVSLVFTYSRGAWIGVAVAITVYVLMKDKRLIIPVVVGGLLILILVPTISNRILYMLSPDYMQSSMKGGRLIRWLTGIQMFREHPWIGLGLGAFGGAVAANHGLSAIVQGKIVDTFYMDNYYMKILVEAGLVGIIGFILLMWQVFSISLKTLHIVKGNTQEKELGIGILAGLTGVMVHCFVENIFEVPMMGVLFWVFVAAMAQLWYSNYKKQSV